MKLKPVKKFDYYYHITSRTWRKTKRLKPQIPLLCSEEEPIDIKRICVCADIAGCLTAIGDLDSISMDIYRTKNKVRAYEPYSVFDKNITKEKWLIKPTIFVRVGKMMFSKDNPIPKEYGVCTWQGQLAVKNKIKKFLRKNKIKLKP
jgi:hypothetical protein